MRTHSIWIREINLNTSFKVARLMCVLQSETPTMLCLKTSVKNKNTLIILLFREMEVGWAFFPITLISSSIKYLRFLLPTSCLLYSSKYSSIIEFLKFFANMLSMVFFFCLSMKEMLKILLSSSLDNAKISSV